MIEIQHPFWQHRSVLRSREYFPKLLSFLIFISLFLVSKAELGYNISFQRYTNTDGLSNSYINTIIQDRAGFIWIGTNDGLNRFDGYQFTSYKNNPGDTTSLKSSRINALAMDHEGNLIIGTLDGLEIYDREKDAFNSYWLAEKSEDFLDQMISHICVDNSNNLWVASPGLGLIYINASTRESEVILDNNSQEVPLNINYIIEVGPDIVWLGTDNGLFFLDRKTKSIKPDNFINNSPHIPNKKIITLAQGLDKSLLIGTENGLVDYNPESKTISTYLSNPRNENSISNGKVVAITKTRNNEIWIGTANGLNLFNPTEQSFLRFYSQLGDEGSLYSSRISAIYEDNQGNLWVGNRDGAINLHVKRIKDFRHYKFPVKTDQYGNVIDLFQNLIISIHQDRDGIIWLGTNGGGLEKFNRESHSQKSYISDASKNNSIGDNVVFAILEDQEQNLWVGNYTSGLGRFDKSKETFTYYTYNESDPESISGNDVRVIFDVDKQHLFVGTNNSGLNLFNKTTGKFLRITIPSPDTKHVLMSNSIKTIAFYKEDHYWIGTVWGLYLYNIKTGQFKGYFHNQNENGSLNDNFINVVYMDPSLNTWIGTNSGLHLYRPNSDDFLAFTQENGLPSNAINGILSDDEGNLWISTNNGISRVTLDQEEKQSVTCKNYDVSNGLQSNEFFPGSYFISPSGEMFFGGNNGFNSFFSEKINDNPFLPPVCITNFSIFNQSISHTSKNSPLQKHISHTEHISLTHKENVISFEFVALNFINSKKNRYQYMLEGFNTTWIDNGFERKATFTNLDPGKYTFRVRASNDDGIWSEHEASLLITVIPPIWKRWWAFMIYNIVIFLIIYSIIREVTNREKLKSQLKLEKFENHKIREIEQIRTHFFTNISHELRTPLTLIINPLEKYALDNPTGKKDDPMFQIMYWNAKRLLFLINQLLDFRKMERGKLKLSVSQSDIVMQIKNLMSTFAFRAEQKKTDFRFHSDVNKLMAWYDPDKIEKILINLIANAFKFSPDEGRIYIWLKITDQVSAPKQNSESDPDGKDSEPKEPTNNEDKIFIEISVEDSGIGIPEENLESIFDRFYQITHSQGKFNEGSGIGLSLAKEMVELHHGFIKVESQVNKGSIFRVYLPMGRNHFSEDELNTQPTDYQNEISDIPHAEMLNMKQYTSVELSEQGQELPQVLVVDDNEDIINYLKIEFNNIFRIISARNGTEGLEKATSQSPDLIVSDIMMPVMDGLEFCKKIKTDLKTSHIPVVLLTARTAEEHMVEGLETGADDYVVKPFNTKVLQCRISNLIESRKKLRSQFKSDLFINIEKITPSRTDEKFMQQALKIVSDSITDPDFDNDVFISKMGMSRSVLYAKLKAITDKTVSEFINTIRLKTAAQLLLQKDLTIGEILYKVGFNNRAYFSKCFREEYGMSASEYIELHTVKDIDEKEE